MTDEWTDPLTVEQMYGEWGVEWDDAMALTDRSLDPRPRTSIYDTLVNLRLGADHTVLDIGGRDASDALALVERFGCRVVVVDPVQLNIDDAQEAVTGHAEGQSVEALVGSINHIPVGDDTVDVVFSRDMLTHVADLDGALSECRRVLRPGGSMVIHQVFGTAMLEPIERDRICADLASVPERLDVGLFEDSVRLAGFEITALDRVGSEWLESLLEGEDGEKRLLRAARMRRAKDDLVAEVGVVPFRVMQANNLWTIYRMIGKLEERVYTLRLVSE